MFKFNTPQNMIKYQVTHKIRGAHLHYAKFAYKGIKTFGVTHYTQITQCKHPKFGVDVIISRFNISKKNMIE